MPTIVSISLGALLLAGLALLVMFAYKDTDRVTLGNCRNCDVEECSQRTEPSDKMIREMTPEQKQAYDDYCRWKENREALKQAEQQNRDKR